MSAPGRHGERGQATVELVALLPVLATIALMVGQLLAAGAARERAEQAAHAGAIALLEGGDPAEASRAAVPASARRRMDVAVDGQTVTVVLRPAAALPVLGKLLTARAEASAGS